MADEGAWDDDEFDVPDLGPPVDEGDAAGATTTTPSPSAQVDGAAADDEWLGPSIVKPTAADDRQASTKAPVDDRPMIIVDLTLLAAKEGLPELHNRFGAWGWSRVCSCRAPPPPCAPRA